MENISVISYGAQPFKIYTGYPAGREVVYIHSPKSRRRLRKHLKNNDTKKAVISGDVPFFVFDVLRKCDIDICTGEAFMQAVYPKLISRASKMNKDCDFCTVYDEAADNRTVEIIKCAAGYFKHVSLCSPSSNAQTIAEEIMESTGLALKLGEWDGVGIICSGTGGRQKVKVDLTTRSKTVFTDGERNVISPSLAEALAGDNIDSNALDRLNLKIYSLC